MRHERLNESLNQDLECLEKKSEGIVRYLGVTRRLDMTSKERVKCAAYFQNPDRLPVVMVNREMEKSDIIFCDVVKHFEGEKKDTSEFGFTWERLDETMGQPLGCPLADLDLLEEYQFPDPKREDRFLDAFEQMKRYGEEKYYIANLSLSGFTAMTLLHGYEDTLCDLYTEPEQMEKLADRVFGFEEQIILECAGKGFSAVSFFDDWGTQENLLIHAGLWRSFFKPRYKRQFDLCHKLGLDVYFHSCGYIYDIIEDLIEIGVDILNLSQPNLFDVASLGREFGGRLCFVCPVSYQTTSITGTREDIFRDVKLLKEHLGSYQGGLMGYVEEYSSIGMSDENYQACKDAFFQE